MKSIMKWFLALGGIGLVVVIILSSLIYSGTKQIPTKHADTLIILGTQVVGTPAVPSTILKERLATALTYLKENPTTQVIVTGGQGKDESATEASVMADYLLTNGIASSRITEETKSTNTKENLANAKKLKKLGKTVIVTSDFHIYRSLLLAKRENIDASGLPAVSKSSGTLKSYLRELIALPYTMAFRW